MELTDTTLLIALAASAAISVLAVGVAVASLRSQRKLRRAYRAVFDGETRDVMVVLQRALEEVADLRDDVGEVRAYAAQLRDHDRGAISRVGTVRFDAFGDLGGMLSFSTALLDERGDGVVLTAINGREHTRMYAKPLEAGDSRHNLSEEEREAIERAHASGSELAEPPAPAARRRRNAPQPAAPAGDVPPPPPERASDERASDGQPPRGQHAAERPARASDEVGS